LVDNHSTDGTEASVRAQFPQVELLALAENRHFAAGANVGLQRGLEQGADYLWLLNNDVQVEPDALAELVRVAQTDLCVGIVGPALVHPNDPPGVVLGSDCDLRTGRVVNRQPSDSADQPVVNVDYVWGCAMLIRAAALREIGLLEERFVAYFEDTDLCLRARRQGWRTVAATRAVVHHQGSKAANRAFLEQQWLRGRNWWRCLMRHAQPGDRLGLALWLLGWRLPNLLWGSLVTVAVRTVRPNGRPVRLWRD